LETNHLDKKNKSSAPSNTISKDEAREYAESIIYTMHEPLIILDQDFKVVFVSPSFCESFKIKPEETLGKVIYKLGNKQWDIPKLRELLETVLPKKEILKKYEIEHNFNKIGKRILLLNAHQIKRLLGEERITIIAVEDITDRKKTEKKITYLTYHDQLTGLYNRRFFEGELKRLDKKRQLPLSIVIADLNGLKMVNDAFGHSTGDEIIKKVALLLKKACRPDDILARWGGDEFIFLLPNTQIEFAEKLSERIKKYCKKLVIQKIPLSISVGVATKINLEEDIVEIIRDAENNMYKNKLLEKDSSLWSTISALKQVLFEKSNETSNHTHRL